MLFGIFSYESFQALSVYQNPYLTKCWTVANSTEWLPGTSSSWEEIICLLKSNIDRVRGANINSALLVLALDYDRISPMKWTLMLCPLLQRGFHSQKIKIRRETHSLYRNKNNALILKGKHYDRKSQEAAQ